MSLYWAMLAGAIVTSMVGQALLKAGAGAVGLVEQVLDLRTLVGLFLYGGAALLYIIALRRIPMSVALPCTAVSYVVAAVVGYYAFGEALNPLRIGGLAVISLGVLMLAASAT
jgi:multidrug transporter EmrE-like cation transporter